MNEIIGTDPTNGPIACAAPSYPEDRFRGVRFVGGSSREESSPELAAALGRLVLSAGALEHGIYRVAWALRIPTPEVDAISRSLTTIGTAVREASPPWSPSSAERNAWIKEWIADCRSALDDRNSAIHAVSFAVGDGNGGWVNGRFSLRDGRQVSASVESFDAIRGRLSALTSRATDVERHFLLAFAEGIHVPLFPPTARPNYYPINGRWPSRLEPTKMRDLFDTAIAALPPTWCEWAFGPELWQRPKPRRPAQLQSLG